jgi:hypothetical protein
MNTDKINDGGSAFPIPNDPNPGAYPAEPGMSLRDYFAAHAPCEPQQWFVPTMSEPQPKRPAYLDRKTLTQAELHELDGLGEYLGLNDLEQPRIKKYAQELDAFEKASRSYWKELEKQRSVQWPYAWADAMLRARGEQA